MDSIIKGTTPTIEYKFNDVSVSDIDKAYLTISSGRTQIEKDLTDATITEDALIWTLSQAETLSLASKASIMLNWLLRDGTRGASRQTLVIVDDNLKEVVI